MTERLDILKKFSDGEKPGERMPVLFVGHGNPMNAIIDNPYSRGWADAAKKLPVPKAILCISAHWLSQEEALVAVNAKPETIHDFGGFPDERFKVQYPAPGPPAEAKLTGAAINTTQVKEDHDWGLDHGAWS